MSELLYGGKTMDYIAGITPWHLHGVLCLPRDEHGRLRRSDPDLPPWVKVDQNGRRIIDAKSRTTLEQAFKRVNQNRGMSTEQVDEAWAKYRADNPNMGRGGGRKKSKRKR